MVELRKKVPVAIITKHIHLSKVIILLPLFSTSFYKHNIGIEYKTTNIIYYFV